MNRETLYDLRGLLALYPYYQTARLLMLQNLYLLHDPSFDEELRRAAIYITDRKVIFQMVEAAHYKLKKQEEQAPLPNLLKTTATDRTTDLIDSFLDSIPVEEKEEKRKDKKRKPTPADAAVDYVTYLLETEGEEEESEQGKPPSRTLTLIDTFMDDGGFKLPKVTTEDYRPQYTPEIEEENQGGEQSGSGVFTETLARIYIKQGKYERALDIITRLYRSHPHKSAYYTDQMRFLEKLIVNSKNNKK